MLRIGVSGEFLGHGMLAVGGKKDWIGWFAQFGVSDTAVATKLLLVIGLSDIFMAVLVLIYPVRIALLWMTFWGFWTALLRPIVGASFWDFIERFANWGAPLGLLFLLGWPKMFSGWFKDRDSNI